ncbi:sugar transferase [Pseudalkalibacillus berkeleyi]|uniref:Sugar transferase n=1 Tax=Pseudalkalibacillus berkeleyi TaxID=1069813 RepID=A0ABS9H447_9BACL|nr:sugar transferase [Pseudalkalibacillus berkeleyi]MCF6138735.1 sugar transferase [Pseudalkalibacillus berkeleyi]
MERNKVANVTYPIRKLDHSLLVYKRIIDIVLGSLIFIVVSPIFFLIMLVIFLLDGGPIFFVQTRSGLNNKPFKIYKFRTMTNKNSLQKNNHNYSWENGVPDEFVFKGKENPNITKIGKVLRRTSMDELPQIINVLLGTMSLVGPRPEIPQITQFYSDYQRSRLSCKPGITGYAQINGRSTINHGEKIKFDLYYVRNWSLKLDLIILWKTIFQVLSGKGSY